MQETLSARREEGEENETTALTRGCGLQGKIILYLRSMEVVTGSQIVDFAVADRILSGNIVRSPKRILITNRVFDAEQEEALNNCRELAETLGIELQVKDLSRAGLLERVSGIFSGKGFHGKTPSISLDGGAVTTLVSADHKNEGRDVIYAPPLQTSER